jgi:hypothetical protein
MIFSPDELVQRAEKIILAAKEKLENEQETGKTQTSKAVEVAKAARSLRVFQNWLRYQMARENFWRLPVDGRPLAQYINEEASDFEKKSESKEAALKALVQFLGYLRRALIAVKYLDQIPPMGEQR